MAKIEREYIDLLRGEARAWSPWTPDEQKQGGNNRDTARALLCRHDHEPLATIPKRERDMVKDNCGACALARAGKDATNPDDRPNYSGWLRVYLQAGEAVPMGGLEAEVTEAARENPAFA